ncbi:MAG: acyl-CoA dehydrogenase family protein [Burkholderiaceae bacterium]
MDFDFSLEQKQLKDQVRRYLTDHCGREAVRKILDGPEPTDRALWRGLGEMGYLGASIPEAYGGLGAGYLEACVIAEELGRAVAPVPYVSSIAVAAECLLQAGSEAQKQRLLPDLAAGRTIGTLAWVEHTGRPDRRPLETRARADGGAHRLSGRKLAVADGDVADFAIVSARVDAGDRAGAAAGSAAGANDVALFVVDLNAAGVTRTPIATIDPTRSHAELTFDDVPAEALGAAGDGARILDAVFDRAAVLIAFEQIGGADRALEMGRDYALERFAFGRPIGSLQAIKHMLADMYVSATLARSNAYYGAWALSTDAAELPVAAATARVSATQAYQHCARNDIQVHGGMGFTWEFDCHLYYRRSNLLALTLGAPSVWEDRLIRLMREQRDAA